jgi:hypothetical protein
MQFQVPQNIDLEDKIVGPLTMTQFVYVLGGGLIDYILFQSVAAQSMGLFLFFAIPVTLIALSFAFLKIQEQPLTHFFTAWLVYLGKPKKRIWKRDQSFQPILTAPPKKDKSDVVIIPKHHLEKSELEQLAYSLDMPSQVAPPVEAKNFGKVAKAFEQLLREQPTKPKV